MNMLDRLDHIRSGEIYLDYVSLGHLHVTLNHFAITLRKIIFPEPTSRAENTNFPDKERRAEFLHDCSVQIFFDKFENVLTRKVDRFELIKTLILHKGLFVLTCLTYAYK